MTQSVLLRAAARRLLLTSSPPAAAGRRMRSNLPDSAAAAAATAAAASSVSIGERRGRGRRASPFSSAAATIAASEVGGGSTDESPPPPPTPKHERESFLSGTSSLYVEQMYETYESDPNSVHETWRKYFEDLEGGTPYDEKDYASPTVLEGAGGRAAQSVKGKQMVVRSLSLFFF